MVNDSPRCRYSFLLLLLLLHLCFFVVVACMFWVLLLLHVCVFAMWLCIAGFVCVCVV